MKKWLELSKADRKGVRELLFKPMYDRRVRLAATASVDINKWVGHEKGAFVVPQLFKLMFGKLRNVSLNARIAIVCSPEMMIYLKELGYSNVTLISYERVEFLQQLAVEVFDYDYISWEELKKVSKKFDVIIGNPPYQGKAQLHQQFFNAVVENWLADGGRIVFIQPATPYENKKGNRSIERNMQALLKKYKVCVEIVGYDVFESIQGGMTNLAITTLEKVLAEETIDMIKYRNGDVYYDVPLEEVNALGMPPKVWASLRTKFSSYIEKHGSLWNITVKNCAKPGAYMQGKRSFTAIDGITLVTNNKEYHTDSIAHKSLSALTVVIPREQYKSFYSYAMTFVARMGLSFLKCSIDHDNGEMSMIPLVPFDRHWTDEELAKLIGLTDEELETIRTVLPDYHGLLATKETAE